jgi:hypothetical protein
VTPTRGLPLIQSIPMIDLKQLTSRKQFGQLMSGIAPNGVGAEIGVAFGENAKDILDGWPNGRLYLIDPYKIWPAEQYVDGSSKIDFKAAFEGAMNDLAGHLPRVCWQRMTSDEALAWHPAESLDCVYLDGNHHNPQIHRDIYEWWKVVRRGGILGGHDYYNMNTDYFRCDVKSEVDGFCEAMGLTLHTTECTSWWIAKP